MSNSPMPARHSAALYDALEAVDAFIRTRRPSAPAGSDGAAPSTEPAERPTPRRRAKRNATAPSVPAAAHGAALR